LHFCS